LGEVLYRGSSMYRAMGKTPKEETGTPVEKGENKRLRGNGERIRRPEGGAATASKDLQGPSCITKKKGGKTRLT